MKVYLVGEQDAESHSVLYVCKRKKTALKLWNEIRKDIIADEKNLWKTERDKKLMLEPQLKNLSETDPDKLDNYPHNEPFIEEFEVIE